MRSGKNTEQFYGFFNVNICGNICGALITAKKIRWYLLSKKILKFFMVFFTQIFPKTFVVLKIPQRNTIKFAVEKNFKFCLHFLRKYLRKYFRSYKHPQLFAQNFWKIYFFVNFCLKIWKNIYIEKKSVKFYGKIYICKKFRKKLWYYLQS